MNAHITESLSALRRSVDEGRFSTRELDEVSRAAREAGGETLNEVLRVLLADDWPDDPTLRGYLSVTSGALVESGGDPRIGASKLLDGLADGFTSIREGGDAMAAAMKGESYDAAAITPSQRRWVEAFDLHVVGAMARLARDASVRAKARAHTRLVEAVNAVWPKVYAAHVYYIATVLALFDDAPFVVVDLPEAKVTRYRAFGANKICEVKLALEKGEMDFDGSRFTLPHRYLSWQSLSVAEGDEVVASRTRQRLRDSKHPSELPRFESVSVIVRVPGSDVVSAYEVGGVHDYLEASVRVEGELDAAEAREFIVRMARAADADPPTEPAEDEDEDTDDAVGEVSVTVLHPDGTIEGGLTDPIAQSALEAMAKERGAESLVVYRPNEIPPALARALPSPKGAHDRLYFIGKSSRSGESALDDLMENLPEPPMDQEDIDAGSALASAVNRIASTNPALDGLVPCEVDPASGRKFRSSAFHTGPADEVERYLRARGHRLVALADVLRGVAVVRVVNPDGSLAPQVIRAVRVGGVVRSRSLRPITAGLFVAVPPREADECAFYSPDGTLVAYVAPGFDGDCQEVTLRPAEAHEKLDPSTLDDTLDPASVA